MKLSQLGSAAQALLGSMLIVATGNSAFVPPSTERDRMKRCGECPALRHGTAGMSCADCGCALPFKATVAVAKCPRDRWPA